MHVFSKRTLGVAIIGGLCLLTVALSSCASSSGRRSADAAGVSDVQETDSAGADAQDGADGAAEQDGDAGTDMTSEADGMDAGEGADAADSGAASDGMDGVDAQMSTDSADSVDGGDTSDALDGVDGVDDQQSSASMGCGLAAKDSDESYVAVLMEEGGTKVARQFYLSRPENYNSSLPHRLIVGLHGRDYSGQPMKDYLGLEAAPVEPQGNEIFVYPDALLRNWGSWGDSIGWQLGPGAANTNAAGLDDNAFIDAMLEYMLENYCIDTERVFVTGQSWGGDYTNVQACLRGDIFRAAVPVAANGIYYLENPSVPCVGDVAVWPMHGLQDEYFPVSYGEEYLDFWLAQNQCSAGSDDLGITTNDGLQEQCVEYTGCTETVRWCLYASQFGHQIPWDYFAFETMEFFRSF